MFRKLIKEEDRYVIEGLHRNHEDMYLCTPLLLKARMETVDKYYNHMKKHCQGAEDFLLQTQGDWDDIYKRDSELFDDGERGWQGLVALTSDRQYMGHVYIRRGSRFGPTAISDPTAISGRRTRLDQLDYMEMLGIRQSLRNVSSCQGPNTLRLSVSKILLCGVEKSLHTNELMGVDVYNPLPTMTKILKAMMFQSIGCFKDNIRHMRADVDVLSRTLQTKVDFVNQPLIFAPCESFVTAAVSDYMYCRTDFDGRGLQLETGLFATIWRLFSLDPYLSMTNLRSMDLSSSYVLKPDINHNKWEKEELLTPCTAIEKRMLARLEHLRRQNEIDYHTKCLSIAKEYLSIAKEVGDKAGESRALRNLGEAHRNMGKMLAHDDHRTDEAIDHYRQSLTIFEDMGDKFATMDTSYSLGRVFAATKQSDKAIAYYNVSLSMATELGDVGMQRTNYSALGELFAILGQREKSEEYREKYRLIHPGE